MAYTAPSTQSTGHLVTAAEWNILVNDIIYLYDGNLRMGNGTEYRVAVGLANSGSGFGGGSKLTWTFAHGLGATPAFVILGGSYIAAASTSTGVDETCANGYVSVDGTNVTVRSYLTGGATASVGPSNVPWVALYT